MSDIYSKEESGNLSYQIRTGIILMLFSAMLIFFTYPAFNEAFLSNLLGVLLKKKLYIYDNKYEILLLLLIFFIGCFIPEIEYKGFTFYSSLYKRKKTGIKHIDNNIKLPGLMQRMLFYIFRNGTFIEECYDTHKAKYEQIKGILNREDLTKKQRKYYNRILKKENRVFYDWIQESENPIRDLIKYGQETNDLNLARSRMFHTLDITFLLMTAICFLLVIVNIFLKFYFSYDVSYISPIVIGVMTLFFHFLSRSIAKTWAAWYFRDIDYEISEAKNDRFNH